MIPRLRTGSTQEFELRRSQSSVSSTSEVLVNGVTNKGCDDLLLIGTKLRSGQNVDGDERRSSEAGVANAGQPNYFEEGEILQSNPTTTMIGILKDSAMTLSIERIETQERTSKRSESNAREQLLPKGSSKSKTKRDTRRCESF